MTISPLIDTWGRVHTNLRISVTDRCNIRCFYCMPNENVQFRPRSEILTIEEIERVVRIAASMGINKLRITGGEPLVRADLPKLIERLAKIDGITDIAMTTNGILLAENAEALKAAGLHRLNISLDSLCEETFQRIARRSGLDRVIAGIQAAQQVGFEHTRLNAVALRGITEREAVSLVEFAHQRDMEMRFIEYMPLDAEDQWQREQVLTGAEIREIVERELGILEPTVRTDHSQPAVDYQFVDGGGRIGFIDPISQPFCGECNRIRLTAEGKLRNCLFSTEEWDVRELLRGVSSDANIAQLFRTSVQAKRAAHGIDSSTFTRPDRAMFQIGG